MGNILHELRDNIVRLTKQGEITIPFQEIAPESDLESKITVKSSSSALKVTEDITPSSGSCLSNKNNTSTVSNPKSAPVDKKSKKPSQVLVYTKSLGKISE